MAHYPSHTMQPAAFAGGRMSSSFLATDAFERLSTDAKAEYLARRPGLREHTLGNSSRTPSSAAGLLLLDSSLVPGVRSIDFKVASGPGGGGANAPHVRAPPKSKDRRVDGVLLHAAARLHVSLQRRCVSVVP